MVTDFQPDYILRCRNCGVVLTFHRRGPGRLSAYCGDVCKRAWCRGYERRKQAEHRAAVNVKLTRLAVLEELVADAGLEVVSG